MEREEAARSSRKARNRESAKTSRRNQRQANPVAFRQQRAEWERNRPGNKRARRAAAGTAGCTANGEPMPASPAIDTVQHFFLGAASAAIAAAQACGSTGSSGSSAFDGRIARFLLEVQAAAVRASTMPRPAPLYSHDWPLRSVHEFT